MSLIFLSGPMTIDRAHGLVGRRRPALRCARLLGRQHAVELGDREIPVGDDRVVDLRPLGLLDVGEPARMGVARVDAQADELGVALGELGLDLRHVAELGGADRGEVLGVGKQDRPLVADPLVKTDLALRRFSGEVGSSVVEAKGHGFLPRSYFDLEEPMKAPPRRLRLACAIDMHNAPVNIVPTWPVSDLVARTGPGSSAVELVDIGLPSPDDL